MAASIALSGHHYHRRVDVAVGYEAQHLVAVEIRHAEIKQDHVELLLADGNQRGASAVGGHHIVIAGDQKPREPLQNQRLVVDQQQA